MQESGQYKRVFRFIGSALIFVYEVGVFAYLWYSIYQFSMEELFWHRGNWAVVGLYAMILFFLMRTYGGFSIGLMRLSESFLSHILTIICANFVGYFEIAMLTITYHKVMPFLMITLAECLFSCVLVYIFQKIYERLYPPHRLLVIYGEYSPDAMVAKMKQRSEHYKVDGLVHISVGMERLSEMIGDYEGVVLCDLPAQERNDLLKLCFDRSVRTYVTPKISDILFSGMDDIYMFDTPLYLARNQGLQPVDRMAKRIFDVIFSMLCIVIASPIMLLIAVAIKIGDGGPVFYTQTRLTVHARPFQIIKFRTMRIDAEKDGARLAARDDERITTVGRFLRASHLDELPQLFNVFIGDMSMVGPRPERPEIFEEYEKSIPEFAFRLKVRAGLTGFAQVYGQYNTTPYDKLKLDMTYIQQFSLVMDLKILFLTGRILFVREKTEGVDKDQTTSLPQEASSKQEETSV